MGKVEKVIVLSVLFVIALILVGTLTIDAPLDTRSAVEAGAPNKARSGPPAQPSGTGQPADAGLAKASGTSPGNPAGSASSSASSRGGMLSMDVDPRATRTPGTSGVGDSAQAAATVVPKTTAQQPAETSPSAPAAAALPAGALLKTLDGLQDSILPEMKLYTCVEGDSYRKIADTYSGDWTKFTVLRRSNEGRNVLEPGLVIFVPVFDSEAPATAVAPKVGAAGTSAPVASGKIHVVKEGESLWKIAKQELGNGGRWQEIADLNKDVLPNPKVVKAGLRLRLP
jgi:nucleoid-associated protein YgaU